MCECRPLCVCLCVCTGLSAYLKAVVLTQDGAVYGFDEDLLLHAEIQSFHCTAGAEQRLVRARFFQSRHQMRSECETDRTRQRERVTQG